jgi:hypothetical protein
MEILMQTGTDCNTVLDPENINIELILNRFHSFYKENFPDFYIPTQVLPQTQLYPVIGRSNPFTFNEYSITRVEDRLYLNQILPIFKVFDCGLCYLTRMDDLFKNINSQVKSDGKIVQFNPTYTKIAKNLANENFCYQVGNMIISMTTPIYYYKHALMTSVNHIHTYSLYTLYECFEPTFNLLKTDENIIAYHNGSFGSDQPHFHVHLTTTKNLIAEKVRNNQLTFENYMDDINIAVIDEPVQKGVIFQSYNMNSLFLTLNRIYTKLVKKDIFEKYHLVSSLFVRNEKYNTALFLYDIKASGIIPHAGLIFVTTPDSPLDDPSRFSGNFKIWGDDDGVLNDNDQTYEVTYANLSLPSEFFNAPILLVSQQSLDENYRNAVYSSFTFENIYANFIVPKIYSILENYFYNRNSFTDYMKYKILLTIFFAGKTEEFFKLLTEQDRQSISSLFQTEIRYLSKLYGINTNLSFLKGDALSLLIELSTNNQFFVDMVEVDKRIGSPSAYGQAYKTNVKDIGDSMIKFTTNIDGAYIEYLNGKQTNKLRKKMPHFMYVYGILTCNDEVIQGSDGISLKNKKLCQASSNIPPCDLQNPPSQNIICYTPSAYLFVELLQEGISMEKFIQIINPNNDKDVLNFFSVITQIALALKIAQESISFNHNDLHLNNIILMPNPNSNTTLYSYKLKNGKIYNVAIYDWIPVIIDPGNSRTEETKNQVAEFWSAKLANNKKYYEELSWFSEDSDILTLILTIKSYWYKRFYDSNISYENSILTNLNNISFYKMSMIDLFLDHIQFRPGGQVNYQAKRASGGIRHWSFVVKDYPPTDSEYKGINEIIELLMAYQHFFKKENFELVFDWGYYLSEKLGPETQINPKNLEVVQKLEKYMKKFSNTG